MGSLTALEVITFWDAFIKENSDGDAAAFGRWVLQKSAVNRTRATHEKSTITVNYQNELSEGGKALLLISRLHRLMQKNTKPVLKKIGFAKDHEYEVLLQVCLLETPNKTELANHLLLESTTTVEITRRLVKKGLLKELSDNSDRRSTRLLITDKGLKKLHESYELMKRTHEDFLGCLSNLQIKQLVKLLAKVEQNHT